MREIPLSSGAAVGLVVMATALWLMDFLILLCCFGAVHAPIPWSAYCWLSGYPKSSPRCRSSPVAWVSSRAVWPSSSSAYGAKKVPALAVVLVYRLLTFWVVIIVGWVSIGVIEWRVRRSDPARRERAARRDGN